MQYSKDTGAFRPRKYGLSILEGGLAGPRSDPSDDRDDFFRPRTEGLFSFWDG